MEAMTVAHRQRLRALELANEVRTKRSRLKKDMKAGRVPLREVLEQVPEYARTMKLLDLLVHQPKVGRVKALRVCGKLNLSPTRSLGALSVRQRAEIIALLP